MKPGPMFGRRDPQPIWARGFRFFWPRGGWRRQSTYVAHRLKRLPGSPNRIASGFACGVAVSFTPFIGFHFLLAVILSAIFRGNYIASAVGTVVGNPWTFPIIWIWTYELGRWILGTSSSVSLPDSIAITYMFDHPWDVLWPMTVGGTLTGILAWVVAFFPIRAIVMKYQWRRRVRLLRKARRLRRKEQKKMARVPASDAKVVAE